MAGIRNDRRVQVGKSQRDGQGWLETAKCCRQTMSDIWECHVTDTINDIPARKRGDLNRSSPPTGRIRLSQSFHYEPHFLH